MPLATRCSSTIRSSARFLRYALKGLAPLVLAFVLVPVVHGAQAALAPGDYTISLDHQKLRRSYMVHVPPQAAAGRALPVMLAFHGGGSNAEVMRSYTRMDASANRDGYVVVYPNGSSGFQGRFLTWNAGKCCGPAVALQVDDVGFTLAVLDDLSARVRIDKRRIYATGLSNGAMMAYRLATEASDRIAAVAGVAGAMSLSRFEPARPMPVLHIHSTSDHIARFDGGFGPPAAVADTRMFHSGVEEMLEQWIVHNGCLRKPAAIETEAGAAGSLDAGHTVIRRAYRPCLDGVEVVLLQLGGGVGHVWPGGVRDYNPQLLGTGTAVVDANAEIWRFVSRYRR